VKPTTLAILLPLLRSDETITTAMVDAAISALEGKARTPSFEDNTELISKAEAARLLGWSRTTLYAAIAQDRVAGIHPPRFLEIESTHGNSNLRKCDVIAVHAQLRGRKGTGTQLHNRKTS
jgi:hypothetical protein